MESIEGNQFKVGNTSLTIPNEKLDMLRQQGYVGKKAVLGVRPEHISATPELVESEKEASFHATIDVAELTGAELMLYSSLEDNHFVARVDSDLDIHPGQEMKLAFHMDKVHFFDAETEERIRS